jgi:hypothetical protein
MRRLSGGNGTTDWRSPSYRRSSPAHLGDGEAAGAPARIAQSLLAGATCALLSEVGTYAPVSQRLFSVVLSRRLGEQALPDRPPSCIALLLAGWRVR